MMIMSDDQTWPSYMNHRICWSYMISVHDHRTWCSYMLIVYGDHVYRSCMMIIYHHHDVWWQSIQTATTGRWPQKRSATMSVIFRFGNLAKTRRHTPALHVASYMAWWPWTWGMYLMRDLQFVSSSWLACPRGGAHDARPYISVADLGVPRLLLLMLDCLWLACLGFSKDPTGGSPKPPRGYQHPCFSTPVFWPPPKPGLNPGRPTQ